MRGNMEFVHELQVVILKKTHLVLMVVTVILALSSAYSLAAINQTYHIGFEWYSELKGEYSEETRDTSRDRCLQTFQGGDIQIGISEDASGSKPGEYVKISCSLGKVSSPEYRIKVMDIAQRGNNVEIRISVNTPEHMPEPVVKDLMGSNRPKGTYTCTDLIRIRMNAFPTAGKLLFTFKDQDGRRLGEQYYTIGEMLPLISRIESASK